MRHATLVKSRLSVFVLPVLVLLVALAAPFTALAQAPAATPVTMPPTPLLPDGFGQDDLPFGRHGGHQFFCSRHGSLVGR